jgi:hypothetical protein
MGHLPAGPDAMDCLKQYPELLSFFEEKRADRRTVNLKEIFPPAKRDMVLPLHGSTSFGRRSASKEDNRISFCYLPNYTCEEDSIKVIFAIGSDFCRLNKIDRFCYPREMP